MASNPSLTTGAVSTGSDHPNWLERIDSQVSNHSGLIAALVIVIGFLWRLWLAHATFFNTDEAWHYWLGNRDSVWLAYKASLTINHPPLLILILHFWRLLGTSNLVLRLPSVLAGTAFCWFFYRWLSLFAGQAAAWAGLVLVTFLPPMISMSADLRQYPLLLAFSAAAAYFLERALESNSGGWMVVSSLCLYLAMLSHYGAFFVAAGLGVYAILRFIARKPSTSLLIAWIGGEIAGIGLAAFLYKTHIARLSSLVTQSILPQLYLSDWYFHKGKDHLPMFLYRGTIGIFRFAIGQTQIGQFAAVLFLITAALILFGKKFRVPTPPPAAAVLLLLPFVLNWAAVAAGKYPYGRMRQCVFLAMFGLAGVSVAVSIMARRRTVAAAAIGLAVVLLAQAFGTLQDRDSFPLAQQRHEHLDQMLQFIRSNVGPEDVIFTDQATSFQLRHYLCNQKPVAIEPTTNGLEEFRCEGSHVVFTGPNEGALTPVTVAALWREANLPVVVSSTSEHVWVVQGGWASGLGEALERLPGFGRIDVHPFGKYLELFKLPPRISPPAQG
jgi:hypothetical protein